MNGWGFLLAVALGLLGMGLVLWGLSTAALRRAGLPGRDIVLSDTELHPMRKPLVDPELGLSGRPDYVVRLSEEVWIPVEIKSSLAPQRPYPGHVYQLVAYAVLLERVLGKRVPYGFIRYPNRTFRISLNQGLYEEFFALLERMHTYLARGEEPGRSHTSPARCRACGYREICGYRIGEWADGRMSE